MHNSERERGGVGIPQYLVLLHWCSRLAQRTAVRGKTSEQTPCAASGQERGQVASSEQYLERDEHRSPGV